jgi:hypothetical protein
MIASTRLTQIRIEREEVDRYLAATSRAARYRSAHPEPGSTVTVRVAVNR